MLIDEGIVNSACVFKVWRQQYNRLDGLANLTEQPMNADNKQVLISIAQIPARSVNHVFHLILIQGRSVIHIKDLTGYGF